MENPCEGMPVVPSVVACQDLDLHIRNEEAQEHKGKESKQRGRSGCQDLADLGALLWTSHLAEADARSGLGP